MTIGVIIVTHNAVNMLKKCVSSLLKANKSVKILVTNSSSNDGTIEIAEKLGLNTYVFPRNEFNHGVTREKARKIIGTDIVVMITPDAIPLENDLIEKLTEPLQKNNVAVSYARQIPHDGAPVLESFPRQFNYPNKSTIRSLNEVNKFGVQLFQCSNSCAAWSNYALDEIGGFKSTLTNEDYFACAELLIKGYSIAYVSDAIVKHSHSYNLTGEFQRMFDTGYVRSERPWINDKVGSPSKVGSKYFKSLMKELFLKSPKLIPYAFIQTVVKYLGYKFGYFSLQLPTWFKKVCSGQKYYWSSKYYMG